MKRLRIAILGMASLWASSAMAWWEAGHMLVADIAYHHLKPKAQKEVNRLMHYMDVESTARHRYAYNEKNPHYTLMAASHWPDDINGYPNYLKAFKTYHYIEDAYSEDATPHPTIIPRDNVVSAINQFRQHVSQSKANEYSRARALAFLVHFVGDIHQPLHTAEYYSKTLPKGDRGGNEYKIIYKEPNGAVIKNLHALWDSALALYPSKHFSHEVNDPKDIDKLMHLIEADYPEHYFGDKLTNLDPSLWQQESHQLAIDAHHITLFNGEVDGNYIQQYTQVAEQQIALAGYRLAHVLNKALAK